MFRHGHDAKRRPCGSLGVCQKGFAAVTDACGVAPLHGDSRWRLPSFQEAAAKAKQYEDLLPEVLYKRNTADLKGADQKLIDAEA